MDRKSSDGKFKTSEFAVVLRHSGLWFYTTAKVRLGVVPLSIGCRDNSSCKHEDRHQKCRVERAAWTRNFQQDSPLVSSSVFLSGFVGRFPVEIANVLSKL